MPRLSKFRKDALRGCVDDLIAKAQKGPYDASGIYLDLNAESDILVISCSGIAPSGTVTYGMESFTRNWPIKRLFICDKRNNWYQRGIAGFTQNLDETAFLISQFLRRVAPKRACAIGASGGGYMALLLTARCRLNRALAFGPQTTLSQKWRKEHGDCRFGPEVSDIHDFTGPEGVPDILDNTGGEFHIIYPSGHSLDLLHAERLMGKAHLYRMNTPHHNVAATLRDHGILQDVLNVFMSSESVSTDLSPLIPS